MFLPSVVAVMLFERQCLVEPDADSTVDSVVSLERFVAEQFAVSLEVSVDVAGFVSADVVDLRAKDSEEFDSPPRR